MWNNMSIQRQLILMGTLLLMLVGVLLGGGLIYFSFQTFSFDAFTDASDLEASSASAIHFREYFMAARETFIIQSVLLVLLVIVTGSLILWMIFRRTMRPLRNLSQTLDTLEVNNLPSSIDLEHKNPDVLQLQTSFNTLLRRINATLESQKHFVANAAHELKTPLSSIMTNFDVLEMDDDPSKEDYREVLLITRNNIERMSDLVKHMLELTQLQKRDYEQFSLNELNIISDEMNAAIKAKNLNVNFTGDTILEGSRTLIERAIQNIVDNAIRYSSEGGHIQIIANQNTIQISDNGIGIPDSQQEKVFEPFYCVDSSRSRKLGGSGLGLSIVYQILTRHGLSIDLDSKENHGTTFTIHT